MQQTKRDLLHLFFRRDRLRERIYPTRVTYLAVAVVVLVGAALLLAGAASFRESLGLRPLSSPATATSPGVASTRLVSPTATMPAWGTATLEPSSSPAAPASPAASKNLVRCPITWHIQEAAKAGGGRIGLPNDDQVAARVRQDFREAMQWANAPAQGWDLAEADRYYTPGLAAQVRAGLQLSLNRQEYVQVEMADLGFVSMSFMPDGAGVTFMSVQYEPITQTVRDLSTRAVKRTVVLDDVPYRQVGIAMLYDTQACRWKIDRIEYPEPVQAP